ncbi:hypothetical protein A6R68_21966 [Neotoma lepida]|uniref:Uncharacterized protein n=1 Tax=Neotoma lepida TaxID=56216 RepID=A0A1A6HN28_NEOLE|nr:hypothetical protein A6R68_21966 [Neotoma lepida]
MCQQTGCEGTDDEGTLEEKAALVEKPPHDPEQEGESEESQFLEFDLTVPFLSFMDAEIARFSVSSLLSQLSTVVNALRFFVPGFFKPHQE